MKADAVTKDFISDAEVFSDVFNYFIYGGEPVIKPEQLVERDPTKIALPYGADGAVVSVQRFRDVQKQYAAMTDGKLDYVLCGAENQTEIHYAMAVRNYLYDALDYASQVEEAAKSHRKAMKLEREQCKAGAVPPKDRKKPNSGEFLGGFWKEDRLIPSITICIFFGSEPWDGPLELFDMMEVQDPRILSLVDNYHVHLIAPAQMTDEEIMKFQSSLREVMLFIKYSKDKEKLEEVMAANEQRFREVGRRAAEAIQAITQFKLQYEENEVNVNLCKALQDIKIESEMIGEARGKREGRREGKREGRRQGVKWGEVKNAKKTARIMLADGVSHETVSRYTGLPMGTIKSLVQ